MFLNDDDAKQFWKQFPVAERSYDASCHKNVSPRFYAWFTTFGASNVCALIEMGDNLKVELVTTSFSDRLAYGTIFTGTTFHYKRQRCFLIDDLLFCFGKDMRRAKAKDQLLLEVFQRDLSQIALCADFVIFGPLARKQYPRFPQSPQPLTQTHTQTQTLPKRPKTNPTAVFQVTAELQNDVYVLSTKEKDGASQYFDIACVPDYQTSVMLNRLFRNIKENDNLDALEESDNEDEFEDDRVDKFVSLEASFPMRCRYHPRFKKWVPVEVARPDEAVTSRSEVFF